MNIVITVIALIVVLGIVVFVHELGHFWASRAVGVKVNTFSVGFGPAIFKWIDKRGTTWKISVIPLGGYCQSYGMEDMFDRKKYKNLPAAKKKGHYLSVSAWKQALIVAGGVLMNFALAWGIYTASFALRPRNVQLPFVGQVVQKSVAFDAGVRAGDVVARIDGKKILNWGEILLAKELAANRLADVVLIRGDKLVQVKLAPADRWGLVADGSKTELQKKNLFQAMYSGARETWVQSKTLVVVLKQIVTGERSSKQLGSFITIAQVSGQALAAGVWALLSIIALLSVNLAIVNLLPLPVLDGGYLLILAIEGITRRKLQGRAMEWVLVAGWVLIIGIFILTMKNDIFRLIGW